MNVQTEDVGEEYLDIMARQTNAKRLEERLLSLLATRTGKLEVSWRRWAPRRPRPEPVVPA